MLLKLIEFIKVDICFMKKLYENILHDKNVIKEIFSLMKENSILKEYYKFEIEYSFCTGKVIQKKKEERRKINYTYFVNGIDYSQSLRRTLSKVYRIRNFSSGRIGRRVNI